MLPYVRSSDDGIAPILVPGRVDPFGVRIDPVTPQTGLVDMARIGLHWTRAAFAWSTIQPTLTVPAEYHWAKYDAAFRSAAEYGVTVVATVGHLPAWAGKQSCGPLDADRHAHLAEFLEAAASRYAGPPYNVRYWEFFNEPDLQPTPQNPDYGVLIGGCWGNYPQQYAESLRTAYDAIKRGNPDAVVIFGGLAFDWFRDDGRRYSWGTCPGPYFVRSFLDSVLSAEQAFGRRIFDVMNFHYFQFFDGCWRDDLYGPGVIGKATVIRERMMAHGIYDRPLIATEYGHYASEYYGSSEDLQASAVARMSAEALAADLRVVIWYTMYDDESPFNWGLIDGSGRPRPAYTAQSVVARTLRGARYAGKVTDVSNVAGYRFRRRDGSCVDVAWSADGTRRPVAYQGQEIEITQKLGSVAVLRDSDPNQISGQVAFEIDRNPIYVARPACP